MAKQKNLSLSLIKKDNNKKYNEKKRITFDGGVTLDVDKYFEPFKIEQVVEDIMGLIQESNSIEGFDASSSISPLLAVLTIKHFTSIETDAKSVTELIELMRHLKNGEYFDKIMESFDQEEINKAFIRYNELLSNMVNVFRQTLQTTDNTEQSNVEDI